MKNYRFEVVFTNGKSWIGNTGTIYQAEILASAWAIENGLDRTYRYIEDEKGNRFSITTETRAKQINQ